MDKLSQLRLSPDWERALTASLEEPPPRTRHRWLAGLIGIAVILAGIAGIAVWLKH